MNPFAQRCTLLAAVIATALAGLAMAAPQAAPTGGLDHGSHPSARHSMMKVDANGDGVIDRAEAARHPRLAGQFDTLDKNRDGKLDSAERPAWKGKRGHRGSGHDGRMSGLVALDTDNDGRISRAEVAASPRFSGRFDQADANRDGYLVRSELHAVGEKRRAESAARRAQRFEQKFAEADGNRDGKLSRAEVEAAMPHVAKAFAFHDEDRDGFLTRADLQPMPRR